MQIIKDGPDIPLELMQAHEEGRVVFFCGAGISYPAGLPDFKGLVDEIYRNVYTTCERDEKKAYIREQYDETLYLLEQRLPGRRPEIERALAKTLNPESKCKNALSTHSALLKLARSRKDGALRLVTSNFDHLFEDTGKNDRINTFVAPALPIPKNSSWDGLVYLHGRLSETHEYDKSKDNLIFTSADFGRAYLTEQWAARFIRDLFRNYIVCFVGYSVNDPVFSYMMKALAIERLQDEEILPIYAFSDSKSNQKKKKEKKWKIKGINKPIMYDSTEDHSALLRTLEEWAKIFSSGIKGKESIIDEYAHKQPSESTQQDDFVGRLLWALSDTSGLPAKYFSELDPVPPLEWVKVFSEIGCCGIQPKQDERHSSSSDNHPNPYENAPWTSLGTIRYMQETNWDKVMPHLAHWLLRHLNNPDLILHITNNCGRLSDHLLHMINEELKRTARLENENKDTNQVKDANLIIHPFMRTLWQLLLNGQVKSSWENLKLILKFIKMKTQMQRDGFSIALHIIILRELLSPKVKLSHTIRRPINTKESFEPWQNISYELVLNAINTQHTLDDLVKIDALRVALPMLLDDFQLFLRDALDLLSELGISDSNHDALPSIQRHGEYKYPSDWKAIIVLLWDSWLAVYKDNPVNAKQISERWSSFTYLTFKHLAFLTAGKDASIEKTKWFRELKKINPEWKIIKSELDEFPYLGPDFRNLICEKKSDSITIPTEHEKLCDWLTRANPQKFPDQVRNMIIGEEKEVFLELCDRILKQEYQGEENNKYLFSQVKDHPIGYVTTALLNLWLQRKPNDNDKLPADIEIFLTRLCDTKVEWFRYGRVLLASHLITLFRVDSDWTEKHLLPLFDWNNDDIEAKAVWEGFLLGENDLDEPNWSDYLHEPLLIKLKKQFFNTAHDYYYEKLSIKSQNCFSKFFTYIALEPINDYTELNFQNAAKKLPPEAWQYILEALIEALEKSEQREEYWKNSVLPFWRNIWRKHKDIKSPEITELLANLSVMARDEFQNAVNAFEYWFQRIECEPLYSNAVSQLFETGLAKKYPEVSLKFLDAIIGVKSWGTPELKECLDAISQENKNLKDDLRYQRLDSLCAH